MITPIRITIHPFGIAISACVNHYRNACCRHGVAGILSSILVALFFVHNPAYGQHTTGQMQLPVRETIRELLRDEDTDGDHKITVDDVQTPGSERGDKRFAFSSVDGSRHEVVGTYFLSNLLQELSLLVEAGAETAHVRLDRIYEKPTDRISRSIGDLYWNGLTRRVDEQGLTSILADEKTTTIDGKRYLYVPSADQNAYQYFESVSQLRPALNFRVVRLPLHITADYVKSRDGLHGILSLALRRGSGDSVSGVPFVVPGGRFNEMYGWDSYFIVLGLLHDGRIDLPRDIVDNFIYEITHYGAVLNANRTYYLTRSQPPFLTSMALECYHRLPKDSSSRLWLRTALRAAIAEYQTVWTGSNHLTSTGLSRYADRGVGVPPEVESGHFDAVFARYAAARGMDKRNYERAYRLGLIDEPDLDLFFAHDRAMRESGHDTSYRLFGRCADLVTVDLNSLLYKYEVDLAEAIEREFGGTVNLPDGSVETSSDWSSRAAKRKELMNRFLWDPDRGMFFDYNVKKKERVVYVGATTFYPLWAGLASPAQARTLVEKVLPLLEKPGGIVSSTEDSRGPVAPDHPLRQWDYPYGWAPHQMLVWRGLMKYGFDEDAKRLAYRWLFTITSNATKYNGTITEKYDVVHRTHEVFAEYGNVGTKFSYITREGFGWTNSSFQVGLGILSNELRGKLDNLIPPEQIFPTH
jgi:alpha,alpha-trehalase